MPDDQYVLFLPTKDEVEKDEKAARKQRSTNWRELERWGNRTPYVVSASSLDATVNQIVTVGAGIVYTDLSAPSTVEFDDMHSWSVTAAGGLTPGLGQFTAKVRALYDFYCVIRWINSAATLNIETWLAVYVKRVGGAYAKIHEVVTYGPVQNTVNTHIWIPSVYLEIGDMAKFRVAMRDGGGGAGTMNDVTTKRVVIRRASSIPGSTQ